MAMSEYDNRNIDKILQGQGDWFNAHLLRFLEKVLFKVDRENYGKLMAAFPEECLAIYKFYGWNEKHIEGRVFWTGK